MCTFLHYFYLNYDFSPSGCTFWGKKPWSRKKKLLWQLGTLIGAPAGIGLIAGIAIPAIIIGNNNKLFMSFAFFNFHYAIFY